jgi:fatty-acyl-CoA synthase
VARARRLPRPPKLLPQLGETLTAEEIRDYLTGKVGKFKFPTHYRFVDDLPMVATMKVKKAVLKEQYERGEI